MTVQHKFVSFTELKAKSDGPGGWEGYLSQTGEIDDGGDLIATGAYADTIPDFLVRGFNAESHSWDFARAIGFPLSAKEDEIGLYVTSQFHGTADAQLVRQKVSERLAAGKGVYMSIGYEPSAPPIYITPDEYGKVIPEYSRKGMAEQNLVKALRFPQIRILPKVNLFEGSIVSVPMLRSAEVTAVKSLGVDGLGTGLSFSEHAKWLGTAIGGFTDRTERVQEMDTKEGRVFSQANYDELISLWERLGKLLEAGKPKPKETDEEAKQLIAEIEVGMALRNIARIGASIR